MVPDWSSSLHRLVPADWIIMLRWHARRYRSLSFSSASVEDRLSCAIVVPLMAKGRLTCTSQSSVKKLPSSPVATRYSGNHGLVCSSAASILASRTRWFPCRFQTKSEDLNRRCHLMSLHTTKLYGIKHLNYQLDVVWLSSWLLGEPLTLCYVLQAGSIASSSMELFWE